MASGAGRFSVEEAAELKKLVARCADKEGPFYLTVQFNMTQKQLESLANSNLGKNLKELSIYNDDYDDALPVVDFASVNFPCLTSLSTYCQFISTIHFTKENTPRLKHLSIEQPGHQGMQYFHTDLPLLETMSFQFVDVNDPRQFGPSLSRSPKLRSFSSYKLWGLNVGRRKNAHVLVLPSIETLNLYRSDDLDSMKIWAPKMTELNLQACYDISYVQILDQKPAGYEFGPAFEVDDEAKPYVVNLINTSAPRGNVISHRRCARVLRNDEEDGFGFMFWEEIYASGMHFTNGLWTHDSNWNLV